MTLQQMKCAIAVEKYRNFSLAAESCYLSQSSLSQQITNLERELGVRLFNRTTRTIQVTEAGEEFLRQAIGILHDVETLEQTMSSYSGLLRGTINVGAISALEEIRFSDLITSFYAKYPNLTVNICRANSLNLLDMLEKQTIDIAFLAQPASGNYPSVHFREIGSDEYFIAVPENHPLAGRKTVELAELKDEHFIIHEPNQSVSGLCLQACARADFTPNVVCRIDASSIAFNLVRSGLGVAFFASEELKLYQLKGVRKLRLKDPILKKIVLATSNKYEPSHLVSVFIDFVQDYIETHR